MAATFGSGKSFDEFLTTAIELGCDGLEVEHEDHHVVITAMKGRLGVGIGELKSGSPDSDALMDELWSLRNRTKRIEVHGIVYRARVTTFESFNQTGYRIEIRQHAMPRTAGKPPAPASR